MRRLSVFILSVFSMMAASAQEFKIESFDSNGLLIFNQVSNAGTYRVEWASSPDGPWTNTWDGLGNFLAPTEHSVTCSVPMFYRVVAELGIPMVEIPGGTNSGVNPLASGEAYDTPYPENYSLLVDTFYMDATPVTKAQWDVIYNWAIANGYTFDHAGEGFGENHPVHTVNWFDAVKWSNARSEKEGLTPCYTISNTVYRIGQIDEPDCDFSADGYRLATMEEYEYAARGGLVSQRYPWGNTITHNDTTYNSSSAYSYDVSSTQGYHPVYGYSTAPVDAFAPNGYGLYYLVGGVNCWLNDSGPYNVAQHRLSGGAYAYDAPYVRVGRIGWAGSTTVSSAYGFRCVQKKP